MVCAECDKTFDSTKDYICPYCRHKRGENRLIARYTKDGFNQWGTRYHGVCRQCEAEYPSNMLGMGRCQVCGSDNNPMKNYQGQGD